MDDSLQYFIDRARLVAPCTCFVTIHWNGHSEQCSVYRVAAAIRDAVHEERERCARTVVNYGVGIRPTDLRDMIVKTIRALPDDNCA